MSPPYWHADSPVKIAPNFERLRMTLMCEEPDRVPLLELFHDLEVKEAFLGRPIQSVQDDIEFHIYAGYDYYTFGFQYEEMVTAYDQMGVSTSSPATLLYGRTQPRHWLTEHDGVIANRKDFEGFNWPQPGRSQILAMSNVFEQVTGNQAVKDSLHYLPEDMKLIYQTDGIFERFTKLMGLETLCYLIKDDPALVEEMFALSGKLTVGLFEYMANLPHIGALWLADDLAYTSGTLISPVILRKHLFPWYRKIAEIAQGVGCPLLFHSDGNLLEILDDLIDIGFNALQPIEPKAMDIQLLKERYAGRLCLVGNIDLGSTLTTGSVPDVHREVMERIRQIGPGGGYCVGSSNTVTNYVPLENFKAMVEATFTFGRYDNQLTTF